MPASLESYETAMKKCMLNFDADAGEICKEKKLVYPVNVANRVISYFNQEVTLKK